jgi:hypothetical protein
MERTASIEDEREEWRGIVGLETMYEVSSLGRVRSLPKIDTMGRRVRARILHNARLTGGYLRISFHVDGVRVERTVHHLVLAAFVGPRPVEHDGCHNDGDVWNNRLDNLRWATHQENQRDKIRHGTIARGEGNKAAKLTEHEVRELRRLAGSGMKIVQLSEQFGVNRNHVSNILKRKWWAHV